MNILVIGCGMVGAQLANTLCAYGHDVSVIDADPKNFARLAANFTGFTVSGIPIDTNTLRKAGIEGCDVAAAVTNNDNMNLMVAQMAKEIFGVSHVVTRISDPRKREVFDQFGLNTVCQTSLTVSALEAIILGGPSAQVTLDQSATLSLDALQIPAKLIGRSANELPAAPGQSLVGLLRPNGDIAMMGDNAQRLVIREGDRALYAKAID